MKRDFGHNHFRDKELDFLILKYEQMLKQNLTYYFDVEDFERIVEYYMDMEHYRKALKAVQYAFKLHPSAIHLMVKKAQIYLKNKNPLFALNVLHKLENLESTNTDIYLTKGHAHLLLGNLVESCVYYDKALSITSDDDELIDILQNVAQTLLFNDYHQPAIHYLLQAYELDHKNLMILYDLAHCYDRAGDLKRSIVYYKHYLDVEPYSEHIWFSLGNLYSKTGDYNKSIASYEMAVAINPEYLDALYELAVLLEDHNQYNKALRYYQEYIYYDPNAAEVYLFIGNCYQQTGELDLALEHYRKSLNIESENPETFFAISNVLFKKEHYWDALFYAKRSTSMDESEPRYYVLYGKINSSLKMHKDAAKAFLAAVELKPEMLYYWILLSDELISEKKYERAIKFLQDSTKIHGNNGMILFRLAALYFKSDNMRFALRYFKKAMLIDSKKHKAFFKICPEAKRSSEIQKVIKNIMI